MQKTLPEYSESEALAKLEGLLKPRIEAVERGEFSIHTMDEIIAEARVRRKGK